MPKVELECLECEKLFMVWPSKVKDGRKFCSKACHSEYITGSNHPRWSQAKCVCELCGIEFMRNAYQVEHGGGRFCSRGCQGEWQSRERCGKSHPNWQGGKVERECERCGKQFGVFPSRIKASRGRFCSRECQAIGIGMIQRGGNNPNWRGGYTRSAYGSGFNKFVKETIRARDRNTCQICGLSPGFNEQLPCVHHIDYDRQNSSFNNLIALCRPCHGSTGSNREFWSEYLSARVEKR